MMLMTVMMMRTMMMMTITVIMMRTTMTVTIMMMRTMMMMMPITMMTGLFDDIPLEQVNTDTIRAGELCGVARAERQIKYLVLSVRMSKLLIWCLFWWWWGWVGWFFLLGELRKGCP